MITIPNRYDHSPHALLDVSKFFQIATRAGYADLKKHIHADPSSFRFAGDMLVREACFSHRVTDFRMFRKYQPANEDQQQSFIVQIAADSHGWTRVDPGLEAYLGYSLGEMENDWVITYHPETCEETDEHLTAIMRDLHSCRVPHHQLDVRYQTKIGYSVWAQLTFSLVRDRNGAPEYFMQVIQDISLIKWAELFYSELIRLRDLMDATRYAGLSYRWVDGLIRHYEGEAIEREVMEKLEGLVSDAV